MKNNSDVPLLVDHHQIRLTNYWKNKDLIIKTKYVPQHFLWPLELLRLTNYSINDNAIQSNSIMNIFKTCFTQKPFYQCEVNKCLCKLLNDKRVCKTKIID